MDISRVIVGPIVTEKSERLKGNRMYTLKVAGDATKVDVKNAIKKYFDVDISSVRVMRVRPKVRAISAYRNFTKRHSHKKVIVTLAEKSKTLDLAQLKS